VSAPDRPAIAIAALAYLALVLLIGVWAARRTRSAGDFFVAGGRLGLWVTGLGTMSAAFSGFVFLGGPGLTYRIGLASLMIVLPVGFTAGLLSGSVGRKLARLAREQEMFTVVDAVSWRYRSRLTTTLAALAVLAGTVCYLGLQLQALGLLLGATFGWDARIAALLLGLVVLLAYATFGGMIAGAYTDLVQGGLMLLAALLIFGRALHVNGGWETMLASIAGSESFGEGFLDPLGRVPVATVFGFFFVFGVGVLGQPQMLHRFYMIDDERKLRWFPLVLGGSQTACLAIWLGIGLAVPALVATGAMGSLARSDDAAPRFLLEFGTHGLGALAVVGILSAIMSTADSFLNIGAGALVRDLPRAFGRPVSSELHWGRVAVVAMGLLAALVAWLWSDLIALLGTLAFGIFGAALAPTLVVGLNWTRVGPRAAAASIATGVTLTLALEFLARQDRIDALPGLPPGVLPAAVSLAASFAVLFVVAAFEDGAGRLDPAAKRLIEG